MTDYEKKVKEFLSRVNAKVTINFYKKMEAPSHWHDGSLHNVYRVTIKRNGRQYTYKFYDSIYHTNNRIKPTEYDVLSCLEKYDVGSFSDFCFEFGYDANRETEKIYNAVVREVEGVNRVFGDVIDEFAEICC